MPADARLAPPAIPVAEHGPRLSPVCKAASGQGHALLLHGAAVVGVQEVEVALLLVEDDAEVAVAAHEVPVVVAAVNRGGVLQHRSAVPPGGAVIHGDRGPNNGRGLAAGEVIGLEVIPTVERPRSRVFPDRLQPAAAAPVAPQARGGNGLAQLFQTRRGCPRRIEGRGEDHQLLAVPEGGAVGVHPAGQMEG